MAGLSDMEELIHLVPEKEIAEYLTEAFRCYGAGAYRATIVITNIALFEGLRKKINALSPVSSVCKEVADEINPLAEAQKVFETPLIHKLKTKGIISEFEAERLEQLNKHRNKAAHPSGHFPSAEEARFVFSDAINIFLKNPIRQTTYIVDKIASELLGNNFFPSIVITDIKAVVSEEVSNLDDLAWPFLMSKVNSLANSEDITTKKNAENFALGAATLRQDVSRSSIISKIISPRLSSKENANFLSMLLNCDPFIIASLGEADLLKLDNLVYENAKKKGVDADTGRLSSPANIAARILNLSDEDNFKKLPKFYNYIVQEAPLTDNFVTALSKNDHTKSAVKLNYIKMASSGNFDTANRFANRMSDLDKVFAKTFDGRFCFEIIAGVVRAAAIGAFSAINISEGGFSSCDEMKVKAMEFSKENLPRSRKILITNHVNMKLSEFRKAYLS